MRSRFDHLAPQAGSAAELRLSRDGNWTESRYSARFVSFALLVKTLHPFRPYGSAAAIAIRREPRSRVTATACCVAVFLSVVSCMLYVYETYEPQMRDVGWWEALELIFGAFFGTDYAFRFYLARDKMVYFFEPMPMIDFVTVVPTFIYVLVELQGHLRHNLPV